MKRNVTKKTHSAQMKKTKKLNFQVIDRLHITHIKLLDINRLISQVLKCKEILII